MSDIKHVDYYIFLHIKPVLWYDRHPSWKKTG